MWSGNGPARSPRAGAGLGLKYDNCGPGLDILFAGRAGPGPHNSVCEPGAGRVCTTAVGPGRAGPGPQIIFAGWAWA